MSEDCHDSNNERTPERIERDADMALSLPCSECGEPVFPWEATPLEVSHFDGRPSELLIFHADWTKMCSLKWSAKRLEAANDKLEKILAIYKSLYLPSKP